MKRGHVREDGMVFLRRSRGLEVWIKQERFAHYMKNSNSRKLN